MPCYHLDPQCFIELTDRFKGDILIVEYSQYFGSINLGPLA